MSDRAAYPVSDQPHVCPDCGGWGGEHGRSRLNPEFTPCPTCSGTGRRPAEDEHKSAMVLAEHEWQALRRVAMFFLDRAETMTGHELDICMRIREEADA